jgi:hypothetical protein
MSDYRVEVRDDENTTAVDMDDAGNGESVSVRDGFYRRSIAVTKRGNNSFTRCWRRKHYSYYEVFEFRRKL